MQVVAQIFIGIFGVLAVYFVGRKDSFKKYGYLFGLIAQPFWFYITISNELYGVFGLTILYTYSWWNGFRNHFLKK